MRRNDLGSFVVRFCPIMRVPKYRRHSSGRAFYEYQGKRHYLPGAYNSPESLRAYKAFAVSLSGGVPVLLTAPPSLEVLIGLWLTHCLAYYGSDKHGEYQKCFYACRAVKPYLKLAPREFGPKKLKEIQATLASSGRTRNYINAKVRRIVRMFEWAASEELIDAGIVHALKTVKGITAGRTQAKESTPRESVAWEHVLPVLSHVSETIRTMAMFQWLTGVRAKSIRMAKPEQFDLSKTPWEWRPQHKTEHLGKRLVVFIGPRARALLKDRIESTPKGTYLFRPVDARRNKRYGRFYGKQSYAQAIERGIERANKQREVENAMLPEKERREPIPLWTPHRLRHSKGTAVRDKHGVEAAQAILGHETLDATELYTRAQMEKARAIAESEG